jgi:hypothetical protein
MAKRVPLQALCLASGKWKAAQTRQFGDVTES